MNDDKLMSTTDVAKYLQVPVSTVQGWTRKGAGPRRLRIGKHVRFRRSDIDQWLERLAG